MSATCTKHKVQRTREGACPVCRHEEAEARETLRGQYVVATAGGEPSDGLCPKHHNILVGGVCGVCAYEISPSGLRLERLATKGVQFDFPY